MRELLEIIWPAVLPKTETRDLINRHHAAMRAQGGGNGESHFTVEVVSSEFEGKVSISTQLCHCYIAANAEIAMCIIAPNATASIDLLDITS